MTRRLKVYLPKWMRWFILAILVPVWGLMLYDTFFDRSASGMTPVEFGLMTLIVALVVVMVWLSSAGRLPTHVVEIEDDDAPRPPR